MNHTPYIQEVGGSSPSPPTTQNPAAVSEAGFFNASETPLQNLKKLPSFATYFHQNDSKWKENGKILAHTNKKINMLIFIIIALIRDHVEI